MRILVTGGAGFIGSHLIDALIAGGHRVRILDNLEEQVHGGKRPEYLHRDAEFLEGDVRDAAAWDKALLDMEAVVHCASAVGVAQSQYEVRKYVDVNVGGTAILLDRIANGAFRPKKLLIPTSMTSYGEGMYRCAEHGAVRPGLRPEAQLKERSWEPRCPQCSSPCVPVPTPETADRSSGTIYALSKNMQEDMALAIGRTYGVPVTAFRLFNVYGTRQSLSNPYTGVAAIFLSRLKNGNAPMVYEDGLQSRDFISVHDVVAAFSQALQADAGAQEVFNLGSGKKTSILDVARVLASLLHVSIEPVVANEGRKNDVRHCIADITKASRVLGWQPSVAFEDGMRELVAWSASQEAVDRFDEAAKELRSKGLQA